MQTTKMSKFLIDNHIKRFKVKTEETEKGFFNFYEW